MESQAEIDARGLSYRALNELLRQQLHRGATEVLLKNVLGQRFIGAGLSKKGVRILINGIPGNDLGAFMNGPCLFVYGNAQDCVANTMSSGEVVIYGDAGDVTGYSMRGGRVLVKGDVGYRAGIHMKAWGDQQPVIVIGGRTGDFLGEYMAGGVIIVLGLKGEPINCNFIGPGMHGGAIYIRGEVDNRSLAEDVHIMSLEKEDVFLLRKHVYDFCSYFSLDFEKVMEESFVKLGPKSVRPYRCLYAHQKTEGHFQL